MQGANPLDIGAAPHQAPIVFVGPLLPTRDNPLEWGHGFLEVSPEGMQPPIMRTLFEGLKAVLPISRLSVHYRTDEYFWRSLAFPHHFPFLFSLEKPITDYWRLPEGTCLVNLRNEVSCDVY